MTSLTDSAPAALLDAQAILARAQRDERDAEEARLRYRAGVASAVTPDETVGPHLRPGEDLVAVRASVTADRERGGDGDALTGPLYLTSERLLLLGPTRIEVDLSSIDELTVAGERLLLTLRDGTGLRIESGGPRLLRVEIAAAIIGARS